LAEARFDAGRVTDALALVDHALKTGEGPASGLFVPEIHRLRGVFLRSLGSPAEEVERTLRTGRDRGGAERAAAETSRCHQSRPPGCWLRSAEAGASLHPLTHHTWARVLLLAVVAVLVLAELLLVCCWGAKSSWPKLLSATTILPTRYAHETLDHCSIDLQRLRRLRGRGRQQNPPDLRRREQHAPMLGRSRAAHRSAASATAARGTGTAGGDPAAGTGDGALSTPAAMVAAAADLPVRSLRADSSATLSCPALRPSTGVLNRARLHTVGWRSPAGRSCISINTKNGLHDR
jgi:hypothetical protein